MTDEAYCLRETEKERKALARMSRYKKNGSRTNYVRLPQTYMKDKELKKMNGKIYTLSLGKPMSRDEFKALDANLQREYLLNLATKYEARQIDAARMLGYSQNGFCVLAHKLLGKDTNPFPISKKPSPKWLDFIGPKVEASAQADTAADFVVSAPGDAPKVHVPEKKNETPARKPLALESLRIRYVGSVTDAFNEVFRLVGNDKDYVINIELYPPVPTAEMLPF